MHRSFTIVALMVLLLLLGLNRIGTAQAVYDTVSIYELQFVPDPDANDLSPRLGDTVVVRGLVMHYPRDLWVGARWAVYIVDPDSFPNPWSGFFIIQHDTFAIQTGMGFLEPGMICYFTGVVDEFNHFSQVAVLTNPPVPITIESAGNPLPAPVLLTADDIDNRADAEQWESMWTRVENATIVNNQVPGNWASFTDATGATAFMGEYFNWFRDRLIGGTYTWPAPGTNFNVNGFIRDEPSGYTTNPRDTLDLEILTNPPVISDVTRNPGVPTSSDAVTVSATIVDNGFVQSATVHYSVDEGAWQQLAMTANQDTFSAQIPPQSDGAFVRYFVSAMDNDNEVSTFPGDTSRATGRVFFYTVRDAGLTIEDVQNTHGYAADNSGYEGYEVTLQGVVMTDSTDEVGDFWIQDDAAPWSGIWVNNVPTTAVKGDLVSVTGTVQESFTVTRLDNVTNVSVVTPGVGEFPPIDVTTGAVTTGAPTAEMYEDVLVRVQNVTVTDPFPDGFPGFGEFVVDDGTGGVRVDDFFDAFSGQVAADTTFPQGAHIDYIIAFGYFSFSNYKLIPRDSLDVGPMTAIGEPLPGLPTEFALEQNYPNPFNPTTDIEYSIARAGQYRLEVFNILGQRVRELASGYHNVGNFRITWDGRDDAGNRVSSGVYIYRLSGRDVSLSKKMILLK